jgi:SAM-dependent methyltransferase
MFPLGRALADFAGGETDARLILRRDDGFESELPIGIFFSDISSFSRLDVAALAMCRGKILDVGAGAGRHSLELQNRGFEVVAVDVCPGAVDVMRKRGVKQIECVDVRSLRNQSYDTILLLMHGIGIAETEKGSGDFLKGLSALLNPGGRILMTAIDVRRTDDPVHLDYQKNLVEKGKYRGDIRLRLEYEGDIAPWYNWVQLDPDACAAACEGAALGFSLVEQNPSGEYLAELVKR